MGVRVVPVGIEQQGPQAGGSGAADVHRHRVADVRDAAALDVGKVGQRVLEDLRVGLGDPHDVAVDHAPHRHADAFADLTDLAAKQLLLDLTAGVADHAHRYAVT